MRGFAAEHIDLAVDVERQRAAKQRLGKNAARHVAITPFVEPVALMSCPKRSDSFLRAQKLRAMHLAPRCRAATGSI